VNIVSVINWNILYINDPIKGRPLFGGKIFVGIPDLDPEVVGNQKQLNVIQEDGTVVAVPQPFILSAGGVPMYNGSPVRLDVEGNFSIKILDRNDSQTYYIENIFDGQPVLVADLPALVAPILEVDPSQAYEFTSVDDMKTSLLTFPYGKTFTTKTYYDGDLVDWAGGASYTLISIGDYGSTPDGFGDILLDNGDVAARNWSGNIDIESIGLKANDGTFDNTIPLQIVHNARVAEAIYLNLTAPSKIFTFKTTFTATKRIIIRGTTHFAPLDEGTIFKFDNDTDDFIVFPADSSNNLIEDILLTSSNIYWTFGDTRFPDESYVGNVANAGVTNTAIKLTTNHTSADSLVRVLIEGFHTGIDIPGNWFGRYQDVSILSGAVGIDISNDRTSHLNRFTGVSIARCTLGVICHTSSSLSFSACNISSCLLAMDLRFCRAFSINESYMELNETCIILSESSGKLSIQSTLLTCVNTAFPNNATGSILKPVGNCQATVENCVLTLYYPTQYIVDGDTAGVNARINVVQYHQEGTDKENLVSPDNLGEVHFSDAVGAGLSIYRGNPTTDTRKRIDNITNENQITSRNWQNDDHPNLTGWAVNEQFFMQTLANTSTDALFMRNSTDKANSMTVIDVICDEGNTARFLVKVNASSVRIVTRVLSDTIDTTNVTGGFETTPFNVVVTGSGNFAIKSFYTIDKTFLMEVKLQSVTRSGDVIMFGTGGSTQYDQDIV